MVRIISCYSNSYGPSGVRSAVDRLGRAGLGFVELALRAHDFGGLVIPESAVITPEKSDDSRGRGVPASSWPVSTRSGSAAATWAGPTSGPSEGFELTARRLRFAERDLSFAPVAVSGAGQPTDPTEREGRDRPPAAARRPGRSRTGLDLSLETHKGPTQNAGSDARTDGRARPSPGPAQLRHRQHRLLQPRGRPGRRAGARSSTSSGASTSRTTEGGFEDWYFPSLGDGGAVDFRRVREILDGVGFSGPYTIEIEGIGGEPEPGLEVRHERVARSIRHLRSCGYFE